MAIDTDIGVPGATYGPGGQPRQAFGSYTGNAEKTIISAVAGKRLFIWSLTITPKLTGERRWLFESGSSDAVFSVYQGGTATNATRQFVAPQPDIPLFVVSAGSALNVTSDNAADDYDVEVVYTVVP